MRLTMNCRNRSMVLIFAATLLPPWLNGCGRAPRGPWANSVTIVCEAPGLTPREVETLVTMPVESAVNGITGVERVESVSREGRAMIWLEVDSRGEVPRVRQLIAKKMDVLQMPANTKLRVSSSPPGVTLLVALYPDVVPSGVSAQNELDAELRDVAESSLREQLLAVPGVSQVAVVGGTRRTYQVVVSPDRLRAVDVTMAELVRALRQIGGDADGSTTAGPKEVPIRGGDKEQTVAVIGDTVVKHGDGRPIKLREVADVRVELLADYDKDCAFELSQTAAGPAVIVAVSLQPDAKRTVVRGKIDDALQKLQQKIPKGAKVERNIDRRYDPLVNQLIRTLRRDLPPDVQFVRQSSKRDGDSLMPSCDDRIVVKVTGTELGPAQRAAHYLEDDIADVIGHANTQVQPEELMPTATIRTLDEKMEWYGVTQKALNDAVNATVNMMIHGQMAVKLRVADRTHDVIISTNQPRANGGHLTDAAVRTEAGEIVPLSELVSMQQGHGPCEIYREDLQYVVRISCDVGPRKRSDVARAIQKQIDEFGSPLFDTYKIELESR